jgi:hypothetical protein
MSRHSPTAAALLAAAGVTLLALAGCQRKGIVELVSSELFSLSLGKMEDQIDLFQFDIAMVTRRNTIYMRDGWFYVANGSAGKVMVFSSYGDLLFLLYDPRLNPAPTSLGPAVAPGGAGGAGDEASTRGAVAYPFEDIGEIAVSSDRTLYVEDAVAGTKVVKDAERRVFLSRVILRFDRKGKSLGYLGQEGVGGTPFPFVSALYVTARDQLVVVCRLPKSWETFWYSREGALQYQVEIATDGLPVKPENGVTPMLVKIVPDMESPIAYLVIYFYRDSSDSTAAASGDSVICRAYKLDLRTERYDELPIEFPQNPPRKERVGLKTTVIPSPPSDLLGVTNGGYFSLLAYTDSNLYTLQVLDAAGRIQAQRRMVIEDTELAFRDLRLSATGILYGLLADQTGAHVSWWRSDMLLKGEER